MSETQVRAHIEGTHATITFATDGGLNVLSSEVLRSLGAAVAKVRADTHVRTCVVRAEGKVFLAGADIKEMSAFDTEEARAYGQLGQGVFNDLASLPCVTVAAINGAAMGGGLETALSCDFRIAVKSAKLAFPEVTLGLIPGWNGIPRLGKLIGPTPAKRMYLSGNPISAEEALDLGLVDEVVNSAEDLGSRVTAFCKEFKKAAPTAVALAKRALRDGDDVQAFVDCFGADDAKEGMKAFVEKRPATWME